MANQEAMTRLTFEAGGDLSAHQFKFVTVAADGQVDLETDAGARVTGVLQNNPDAAGKAAQVAVSGRVKVVASATIAAGAEVATTNAGLAVTAAGATTQILGQCLVGGDAGEIVEVLLQPRGVVGA